MQSIILLSILLISFHQVESDTSPTPSPNPTPTPTSTSTSTPSTTPPWINPALGAKPGNPGAVVFLPNKTIDAVHSFAVRGVAQSIQSMQFGELSLASGFGTLTIKPPRIIEAKLSIFEYDLIEPNKIWSRFSGGRLVADGDWQYLSDSSDQIPSKGKYKATMMDTEAMIDSQFVGIDGKPVIKVDGCKANYSQLKVEITGETNMTLIDTCDTSVCQKARKFYEDAICQVVRKYILDMTNIPLSTFPTRYNLSADHNLDYNLLANQPKVTKSGIWAGLEGKIQWRGQSAVPFSAPSLTMIDNNRMFTFGMTDYTFNTLYHQVHSKNFQFSVHDLLSKFPSIIDQLSLNCSSIKAMRKISPITINRSIAPCLGALLENVTDHEFQSNETGDLVYKTDKPMAIFVLSDRIAYFDGGIGNFEIFGPQVGQSQRKLLVRVPVKMIRGQFMPAWNGANITGSVHSVRLILDKSVGQQWMDNDWVFRMTQFATPILAQMFNVFLKEYAQFPIPLLAGLKCSSPQFLVSSRTMQIDCDF